MFRSVRTLASVSSAILASYWKYRSLFNSRWARIRSLRASFSAFLVSASKLLSISLSTSSVEERRLLLEEVEAEVEVVIGEVSDCPDPCKGLCRARAAKCLVQCRCRHRPDVTKRSQTAERTGLVT